MAAIQHNSLLDLLHEGIKRSKLESRQILVSEVRAVEAADPVLFYINGKKKLHENGFFWKDAERPLTLAGLGVELSLEFRGGNDRFQRIEYEWKRLTEDSIISGADGIYGAGPLLLGGFSFDPEKDKTNLWRYFPDSRFVLPKILLTQHEGQAWLTMNILCSPEDDARELLERNQLTKEQIFSLCKETAEGKDSSFILLDEHEVEPAKWVDSVEKVISSIRDEEIEKVVLARELRVRANEAIDPGKILRILMRKQASSYVFAIDNGDDVFIGASPERLAKRVGNEFLSTCLAGSIPRGKTREEDEALGAELLSDQKNLLEHEVVVHMIKEAMMESCEGVELPDGPSLYKTNNIQHLYTPIKGTAKKESSIFSLVEKLHPTPALGGYPQKRAMEMIREVELLDRGWYGAPVGWINYTGEGEFAVAIRSGLIQGTEASLFAGCGIVGESIPEKEYKETQIKFLPMLSSIRGLMNENVR